MNQRIKKLWIKALRGEKYKQATGRLRRDRAGEVRMCCLGVLCEVYRRVAKRGRWAHDRKGWTFVVDGESEKSVTHETVRKWAGLVDENPKLGEWETASVYNDEGYDFNFIANKIEKYL